MMSNVEPLAPCDHLNLNSPVTLAMCAQWLLHWTEKIQDISITAESPTGQRWY